MLRLFEGDANSRAALNRSNTVFYLVKKSLYLHFYKTYKHQIWQDSTQGSDLSNYHNYLNHFSKITIAKLCRHQTKRLVTNLVKLEFIGKRLLFFTLIIIYCFRYILFWFFSTSVINLL